MAIIKIFAESAEEEQWRLILRYTFPNNIEKFLCNNGKAPFQPQLIEAIAGSILQGKEYFDASRTSSLQISPLLLYYGAVNLFYGVACLISGQTHVIEGHGMSTDVPQSLNRIADISVTPSPSKTGGLAAYTAVFHPLVDFNNVGRWSLEEMLASFPDLYEEFALVNSSEPFLIPVESVREGERFLDRIPQIAVSRYADISNALSIVPNLKKSYLPYVRSANGDIVLRPKYSFKDIRVTALSGKKYLNVAHVKGNKIVAFPPEILFMMTLFPLSYISRYHPELWNPFVRADASGERLLIEKFLYFSRRLLPNLMLNLIQGESIQFVTESQPEITDSVNLEIIKDIIKDEVRQAAQEYNR